MKGEKIDKTLLGDDLGPFSAPGGSSRDFETGNRQEIAVRTWWDRSRGSKPANSCQKFTKLPVCWVDGPKIITY